MDAPPSLHPTDQTLAAYGLGKLDDDASESVHAHLESCPSCRQRASGLSPDSFLGRIREAHAPGAPPAGRLAGPLATESYAGPPPATLPPGLAEHRDYRVIRELGRGGMGVVYLAENTLMGRMEVLKVLGRRMTERAEVLDRFLREVRAVARLRHPNIVAAYHAFRAGDSLVFAMEYVDGYDLSKMVKARGPLPVAHACLFAQQAAQGLQHAHETGMVHRDIKPGNLMVARQGAKAIVKVLDFGLAKASSENPLDAGLTHEGQMLGTPDYIAPEQIVDAQRADIRADIYSLGCTLYYLLSGGPPFRGLSLYDLFQAHHSMDAKLLNFVRPEVPSDLAALVAKMMAKAPERRFRTPGEVAAALGPFVKKSHATAAPAKPVPLPPPQSKRPAPAAAPPPPPLATRPARPADHPAPEPMWESLIDFREKAPEPSPQPEPAVQAPSRPRWFWPSVAAGVLAFSFLAAWTGGVVKLRTADGTIVLENAPEDAETSVDGRVMRYKPPGGGKPFAFSVAPGMHKVRVRRGDTTWESEEILVFAGEKTRPIRVRLERPDSGDKPRPNASAGIPEPSRYRVFDENLTWLEAKSRCEALGGHLAIVRDEAENRTIRAMVAAQGLQSAWLGASDASEEGHWTWVDGTNLEYQAWDTARGQPNNKGYSREPEHYLIMLAGLGGAWWDISDESARRHNPGFVCQWDGVGPPPTAGSRGRSATPAGAAFFRGKRFKAYPEQLTRGEARRRCEAMGGRLVVIRDLEENLFVTSVARAAGLGAFWLGLAQAANEGPWGWIDGSPADFTAWDGSASQPNNRSTRGEIEDYAVAVVSKGGLWWDVPDGGEPIMPQGFVCEWPADRPSTPVRVKTTALPTVHTGSWSIEGDQLVQSSDRADALLTFGDPEWSEYDLTLDAQKEKGSGHGVHIVFHRQSPLSFAWFGLGVFDNKGLELAFRKDGKWSRVSDNNPDNWVWRGVNEGEWYAIKLEVRKDHYRAYLDDVLQFEGTKSDFDHGRLGLNTGKVLARFRNVRVTKPDGTVLLEGLPDPYPHRDPPPPLPAVPANPTPLFNGKDLAGWTDLLPNGSEWKVVDGLLEGRGAGKPGQPGVLVLRRDDLKDFRLRVQLRHATDTFTWVEVRRTMADDRVSGYSVASGVRGRDPVPGVGGIGTRAGYRYGADNDGWRAARPTSFEVDRWIDLTIEARGPTVTTWVDGKWACELTDPDAQPAGSIALGTSWDGTVQYRSITLEALPEGGPRPE